MDDGEIIEEGTHDTLLADEGPYADLWEAQTDDEETDEVPALDD
jgi:ABC-type multidrug transport system fused ATPase/permease subunit